MRKASPWAALAAALSCALGGCGTMMNLANEGDPAPEMKKLPLGVYGGVQADAQIGKGYLKECFSGRYSAWADMYGFSVGSYLLAVDMPLSVIGDTVTLPWSVVSELTKSADSKPSKKEGDQCRPTGVPSGETDRVGERGEE